MSEHKVHVSWQRTSEGFEYRDYNRDHEWRFEGGVRVRASAAQQYRGDPALPNPEDALVVALSSCHMLSFLALASRAKFVVGDYADDASGHLTMAEDRQPWLSRVVLRPRVRFSGAAPSAEKFQALHHLAHEQCFIARSVKTEVLVEATDVTDQPST